MLVWQLLIGSLNIYAANGNKRSSSISNDSKANKYRLHYKILI